MITLRPMQPEDAATVLEIYRHGIESGMATFQKEAPDWNTYDKKYLPHLRIVALDNDNIVGWTAVSPVSSREVYKGVTEVSVYVHKQYQRQGIGRTLLQALIRESEQNGIWSLLSIIHEENRASIHLFEQCGFRYIGYRERIAQLDGIWRSTVMMERRSKVVGV